MKALYHFRGLNNNTRNKFLEVGETTQGRTGKRAKRPGGETTRGERESGRNDSGANGKVGETTRIRLPTPAHQPFSSDKLLTKLIAEMYVHWAL